MKTNNKNKRRKLNWYNISKLFLFLAAFGFLACSLFINTRNTNLSMKIQEANEELNRLKTENASINIEIQSLENKDRVYVIAQAADMNQNQANIVSVVGD